MKEQKFEKTREFRTDQLVTGYSLQDINFYPKDLINYLKFSVHEGNENEAKFLTDLPVKRL